MHSKNDLTALSRLEQRIHELQIDAKKSLGQNFLVSDSVIQKILAAGDQFDAKQAIEVGPGCGALTDLLRQKYMNLILIELDHRLADFWQNQGMQVIKGDALQVDWSFAGGSLLISNLPYQISSSLVIDRSLDSNSLLGMVLMFQKEVAQRIRASCKTEHYGMLSVIAQEFWTIETVCEAGPRDFKPAPKVASRVLLFRPRATAVKNRKQFLQFVKACFRQRRRVLTTNLSGPELQVKYDMKRLFEWFEINQKTQKVRVEELSPTEINSLYHFIKRVDES